jgi:hypothetical protein
LKHILRASLRFSRRFHQNLFWNANETRVGSAKHMSPPDVIVASGTKHGSVTVPEIRNDTQLTLLTAISALGDSTCPYLISKIKHSRKQLWRLNSYSKAIIILLEWHRNLLSPKHCLFFGLRRCSLCETMGFVKDLLMNTPLSFLSMDARLT